MVHNTIGMKQGCLFSLTLFELYIDEFDQLISSTFDLSMGCFLLGSTIPILLFVEDVIMLSHTTRRFQR